MSVAKWNVSFLSNEDPPDVDDLEIAIMAALKTRLFDFKWTTTVLQDEGKRGLTVDIDADLPYSVLRQVYARLLSSADFGTRIDPRGVVLHHACPLAYVQGISPFRTLSRLHYEHGFPSVIFRVSKNSSLPLLLRSNRARDGLRDGWESAALEVARSWYIPALRSRRLVCRAFRIVPHAPRLDSHAFEPSDEDSLIFTTFDSVIIQSPRDGIRRKMRVNWNGWWNGHETIHGARILRVQVPDESDLNLWVVCETVSGKEVVVANPVRVRPEADAAPDIEVDFGRMVDLLANKGDTLRSSAGSAYAQVSALLSMLRLIFGERDALPHRHEAMAQRMASLRWGDPIHADIVDSETFGEAAKAIFGTDFDSNHPLASDTSYVLDALFPPIPDPPHRLVRTATHHAGFEWVDATTLLFSIEGRVHEDVVRSLCQEKLVAIDFSEISQFVTHGVTSYENGCTSIRLSVSPSTWTSVAHVRNIVVEELVQKADELREFLDSDLERHRVFVQGRNGTITLGEAYRQTFVDAFGGRIGHGLVSLLQRRASRIVRELSAHHGGRVDTAETRPPPSPSIRLLFDEDIEGVLHCISRLDFEHESSLALNEPAGGVLDAAARASPSDFSKRVETVGPILARCDEGKLLRLSTTTSGRTSSAAVEMHVGDAAFFIDARRVAFSESDTVDRQSWFLTHALTAEQRFSGRIESPTAVRKIVLHSEAIAGFPSVQDGRALHYASAPQLAAWVLKDAARDFEFVTRNGKAIAVVSTEKNFVRESDADVDELLRTMVKGLRRAFSNDDTVFHGETHRLLSEQLKLGGVRHATLVEPIDSREVLVRGEHAMARCLGGRPFLSSDGLRDGLRYQNSDGVAFVNSVVTPEALRRLPPSDFCLVLARTCGRRVRLHHRVRGTSVLFDPICAWAPPRLIASCDGRARPGDAIDSACVVASDRVLSTRRLSPVCTWEADTSVSRVRLHSTMRNRTFAIVSVDPDTVLLRDTTSGAEYVMTNPCAKCTMRVYDPLYETLLQTGRPTIGVGDLDSRILLTAKTVEIIRGPRLDVRWNAEASAESGSFTVVAVDGPTQMVGLRNAAGRLCALTPSTCRIGQSNFDGERREFGGRFHVLQCAALAAPKVPALDRQIVDYQRAIADAARRESDGILRPHVTSMRGVTRRALTELTPTSRLDHLASPWQQFATITPNLFVYADPTKTEPAGCTQNDVFCSPESGSEIVIGSNDLGFFANVARPPAIRMKTLLTTPYSEGPDAPFSFLAPHSTLRTLLPENTIDTRLVELWVNSAS